MKRRSDKAGNEIMASGNEETNLSMNQSIQEILSEADSEVLSAAKTNWYFGEWEELTEIDLEEAEGHPDIGLLSALKATGYQQIGDMENAKKYIKTARKLGCDQQTISRLLVAGVHNTLGKIKALQSNDEQSLKHFELSVNLGKNKQQIRLARNARSVKEMTALGVLPQVARIINEESSVSQDYQISSKERNSRLQLLNQQLNILNQKLLYLHDKNQLGSIPEIENRQFVNDAARKLAAKAEEHEDLHQVVDDALASEDYSDMVKFGLCVELANRFANRNDNLSAQHFARTAADFLSKQDHEKALQQLYLARFIQRFSDSEVVVRMLLDSFYNLGVVDKQFVENAESEIMEAIHLKEDSKKHGHDLILTYLRDFKRSEQGIHESGNKTVFIEIGTTRENVGGQSSTSEIADLCSLKGIAFITVDMDEHCSRAANSLFRKKGYPFKAITQKGEEFLEEWDGFIDYVFLDAYDYDHGKHSELRQSRYEKYLGERIDEQKCHQMHLACAIQVEKKLAPHGVVCIDDTWLDDNDNWTAKGTTAVPYLLEHGFKIIEMRNRAVLLNRPQI